MSRRSPERPRPEAHVEPAERARIVATVLRAHQDALLAGDKVFGAASPEDRILHAIVAVSAERSAAWLRARADEEAVRPLGEFASRLTRRSPASDVAGALPPPGGRHRERARALVVACAAVASIAGAVGALAADGFARASLATLAAAAAAALLAMAGRAWRGRREHTAGRAAVVDDVARAMAVYDTRVAPALAEMYDSAGVTFGAGTTRRART